MENDQKPSEQIPSQEECISQYRSIISQIPLNNVPSDVLLAERFPSVVVTIDEARQFRGQLIQGKVERFRLSTEYICGSSWDLIEFVLERDNETIREHLERGKRITVWEEEEKRRRMGSEHLARLSSQLESLLGFSNVTPFFRERFIIYLFRTDYAEGVRRDLVDQDNEDPRVEKLSEFEGVFDPINAKRIEQWYFYDALPVLDDDDAPEEEKDVVRKWKQDILSMHGEDWDSSEAS